MHTTEIGIHHMSLACHKNKGNSNARIANKYVEKVAKQQVWAENSKPNYIHDKTSAHVKF
jgi:hypothetical protein